MTYRLIETNARYSRTEKCIVTNLDHILLLGQPPIRPDEISGVRNVDLDIQRQLGPVLFCTFDKRSPDDCVVPPHDILGRKNQAELELSDERKQETFHPAEIKIVRPIVKERCGEGKKTVDGLYDRELIPDACTRTT